MPAGGAEPPGFAASPCRTSARLRVIRFNFSEPDAEARARRATHLAHLGELSAARQALLADPLAPPTQGTFEALSNAERRPPEPYTPVDPDLAAWDPPVPVVLNRVALLANLRRARKGAAPGPSGLTAEMLRVVLDDADASQSFSDVASQLACARVPDDIVPALGLGRVVALSKPNGGTRGLVIGDFLRRLVARTLAQQYAAPLAEACHPHQYALGSRVGAEALIHEVQARCAADPRLTVVSLDAAAAHDGMSRQTVLRELKEVPEASALLPFVRLWLGRTSTYFWMTSLSWLTRSEPWISSGGLSATSRFTPASCLNLSKTAIWNGAGVAPDGLHALSTTSRTWLGDSSLAPAQRGLVLLGAPFGTPEFVQAHLQQTLERQATFLNQLPNLHDTQVGWLLLSCCACPRAQYALRTLPPASTHEYAIRHDAAVLRCLDSLLFADAAEGLPGQVAARVQLALRPGGLGLRSAARHAPAAFWASWADTLPALLKRDRPFALRLAEGLEAGSELPELLPLQTARDSLSAVGFEAPSWHDVLHGQEPRPLVLDEPQLDNTRGWQRAASHAVDGFCQRALLRELDASSAALLDSQAGPYAARIFTARPTSPELTLESPLFRALLLRRLRLPLPLTAARCRCRQPHDAFGDHLAACPRSGVLRSRGGPLERAAARVCREAGATVAMHALVRDLNVVPVRQDERRIEVIANGLPLWGGVQLAVDTTLVSPLTAAGMPRRDSGRTAGAALRVAERAKARAYPELASGRRCRLVVLGIEVGGRWSLQAAEFVRLLARSKARAALPAQRAACTAAFVLRWSALLAFAAARTFAASLLSLPLSGTANVDGDMPLLSDVLADSSEQPPLASRMP